MKAIIMAGGEGTRLRPLTCNTPKPMLKVANCPVIDYTVELLKRHGINEIGVTLQYMPKCIEHHLECNKDVRFEFFIERTPLGTAGSIRNCYEFLDEDCFIVMSGDGLTDIDLTKAVEFHRKNNADVTIVLKRVENPLEYGIVITEADGKIIRFAEKPCWSDVFSDSVNTGIYIINKNVLELIEENKKTDFSNDVFPLMMENGMRLYGYVADGYWCDIGNMKSYLKANVDVISGKVYGIDFGKDYYEIKNGVWVGKYAKIDPTATLEAPCIIGRDANIRADVEICANSIIGNGCFVGKHSTVKNSILHDNVYLGNGCQIRGAVIADGCSIGDSVNVFEGCAIGDSCSIGDLTNVKNSAYIWPEKKIDEDSTVQENIVWQNEKFSRYFDKECISGKADSQITPEFSVACAKAFSDKINGRIVIAHNGTKISEMLYNAVLSGVMSSGEQSLELKSAPLPTARYAIRLFSASGGIYIGEENGFVKIFFMDENGSNISQKEERTVENALNSRSFKKCDTEKILLPQNFGRCCDYYERHIINTVGTQFRPDSDLKVRVINNENIESKVFINILSELGIKQSIFKKEELIEDDWQNFDLTVEITDFGEKLLIYYENMEPLDKNTVNLLMNYISVTDNDDIGFVVADYNAPEAVDEIAKANNGAVIRTKSGTRALINEIVKHDGFLDGLPIGRMSMYYDGIMFFAMLAKYIVSSGKGIDELVRTLPTVYFSEKEIKCPWNKRSEVMRKLANNSDKANSDAGIKIRQKYGWSLILPDAKRAVFKIYSEGFSTEYAEELSDICIKKINEYKDE